MAREVKKARNQSHRVVQIADKIIIKKTGLQGS